MIETTSMSKSYKIPIFLAFYNGGKVKMEIDEEDVYRSFYEFYRKGSNKVDMLRHKGTEDFESWDKTKYVRLARENPVRALVRSEGEFFRNCDGGLISLYEDMKNIIGNEEFINHMRDSISYRSDRYYEERNLNVSK
jgi:hypothetical protein